MDIAINEGSSFLICDEYGDVNPARKHGLFDVDTRFLSLYQLHLSGQKLTKLTGRPIQFYSSIHHLTNPAFSDVKAGTIEVSRMRLVGDGLHEDLDIINYNKDSVSLNLALSFQTDFANIFDVKANRVKDKYLIIPVFDKKQNALRFIYQKDEYYRETKIIFDEEPSSVKDNVVTFKINLELKESFHLCIDVLTISSTKEMKPKYTCKDIGQVKIERPVKAFKKDVAEIDTNWIALQQSYDQGITDLAELMLTDNKNLWEENVPAAGIPWFLTLFGRDTLITALQTLLVAPKIAKGVLLTLAKYQGKEVNPKNEEAPGKILHEVRFFQQTDNDKPKHIVNCYYGTVDATLLFIILAHNYLMHTDDLALIRKLKKPLVKALNWIDNYGDVDDDGYIEYKRSTDKGLFNQAWKDSFDAIAFANGKIAQPPIATCEVQGYVYDAKIKGSYLLELLNEKELAKTIKDQAGQLKKRFNKDFWMEDKKFFALALDKNKNQVDSITSNPGHLLWSNIVDEDKAKMVADKLMSVSMFSGWGVRTLSHASSQFNPMSYHNGSVWPHDNSIISYGLCNNGYKHEALQIVEGIISASQYFDNVRLPELFCGFEREATYLPIEYPASNSPQAWAAASTPFILTTLLGLTIDRGRKTVTINPVLPNNIKRLNITGAFILGQKVDLLIEQQDGKVKTKVLNSPDINWIM